MAKLYNIRFATTLRPTADGQALAPTSLDARALIDASLAPGESLTDWQCWGTHDQDLLVTPRVAAHEREVAYVYEARAENFSIGEVFGRRIVAIDDQDARAMFMPLIPSDFTYDLIGLPYTGQIIRLW